MDARQEERIPHVRSLLERPDLEIHIWDHHPAGGESIRATEEHVAMFGSTCTLLTRNSVKERFLCAVKKRRCWAWEFTAIQGRSPMFPQRREDFEAASWLQTKGMDISLIAALVGTV